MKAFLIATSLMFGTAAMAQDAGSQLPSANQPAGSSATSPMPDPNMSAPADSTTQTDPATPAPADSTMTQPGATPPAASAPMATTPAPMASEPSSYPPCSRTLQDKCTNRGHK